MTSQKSGTLMFFPHFYVSYDLLLHRLTETWNLIVYMIKKQNVVNGEVINASAFLKTISKHLSKCC